jgi:hypothetical protein
MSNQRLVIASGRSTSERAAWLQAANGVRGDQEHDGGVVIVVVGLAYKALGPNCSCSRDPHI